MDNPAIKLDDSSKIQEVFSSPEIKKILDEIKRRDSLSYDSLTAEYSVNIEAAAELGKNGWTVHGSLTPNDEREWIKIIDSKGESEIAKYYTDDDIHELIDRASKYYTYSPENRYLWRAFDHYHSGQYTETAMFLLGFFDCRISKMASAYRKWLARCQQGIKKAGEAVYSQRGSKPMTRLFVICDYIPSFSAFAERLFCEDQNGPYNMSTGTEPPYLNRNWLMHGRMARDVRKYECIQLINALDALMNIEEYLEDTDDGQDENAHP